MVTRRQARRTLASVLVLITALAAAPGGLRADAASGTWTSTLEGTGNYYWERSTKVLMPDFRISTEAPSGLRLNAGYQLDVITSASIAQTGSEEDELFSESRHGVNMGAGGEIEVGSDAYLDVTAGVTYSTEDDYRSWSYQAAASLALDHRLTTVGLSLGHVRDRIFSNAAPSFEEGLTGTTAGVLFSRVLNPVTVLSMGYELSVLDGFLANAYRNFAMHPENHPDHRVRHNAHGRLQVFLPATATAFHFMYRAYLDSWDIAALTPEVRVYQELGRDFMLRLRYRHYQQTQAFFTQMFYPPDHVGFVTADPKMQRFHGHYGGIQLEYWFGPLEGTPVGFASEAQLFLSVDRIWNTNAYGNGWIAQLGGRMPF